MLNNGVPVHVVANRLGYADASTTLSVYAHVTPNDDRIAARTIASVLFPAPRPHDIPPRPATTRE